MALGSSRSAWLLRSMLFVPGDQERMLRKARDLPADALILDLEDGVSANAKTLARTQIARALAEGFPDDLPVLARLNSLGSGAFDDDLLSIYHPRLDGVVIPKVRSPADVGVVDQLLVTVEQARGLSPGRTVIAILIETPHAVLHAAEIAAASVRTVALMFGADDLAAEMGLIRTAAAEEVRYPRAHVALVAHAAGCAAIDLVYTAVEDQAGLTRECRDGKTLGYTGKQVIHPSQLDPVNTAFTPDEAQVAWAHRIVEAYRAASRGALIVDGRLVDSPIVAQAQRILADSERITARHKKAGTPP